MTKVSLFPPVRAAGRLPSDFYAVVVVVVFGQDALSGNSKVMMFVNVSPASYNVTETLCSLNFAARCRSVKLGAATKNQEAPEVAK